MLYVKTSTGDRINKINNKLFYHTRDVHAFNVTENLTEEFAS